MKISQEADYAIRVVLHLTKTNQGEIVAAKTIAESEAISLRFLLKLLQKLMKANIVQSFRGIHGGYSLAKLPEEINLRQVIEAIDGPVCMNRCLYDKDYCNKQQSTYCEAHAALQQVNAVLLAELERRSFRDLVR